MSNFSDKLHYHPAIAHLQKRSRKIALQQWLLKNLSRVKFGIGIFVMSLGLSLPLSSLNGNSAVLHVDALPTPVPAPIKTADKSQVQAPVRPVKAPLTAQGRLLAKHIATQYRIDDEAADRIVAAIWKSSRQYELDPILMTAVVAVESRFNPLSKSVAGAKGMTQVIPKYHPEKIRDIQEDGGHILDIEPNIETGARILREYLNAQKQNVTLALQQYNGSLGDTRQKYPNLVMAAKEQFKKAIAQK